MSSVSRAIKACIALVVVTACSGVPDGVYDLPENKTIEDVVSKGNITLISFRSPEIGKSVEADSIFRLTADDLCGEAKFVSVDITRHQAIVDSLGVEAVPAILLIRENGQRDWHIGPMTRDEIATILKQAE